MEFENLLQYHYENLNAYIKNVEYLIENKIETYEKIIKNSNYLINKDNEKLRKEIIKMFGIPENIKNAYFHYLPLLVNYNLFSLDEINSFLLKKNFKYKIELSILQTNVNNEMSKLIPNKINYSIDQFCLTNEKTQTKINHRSLSSGEKLELSIYLRQIDLKSEQNNQRCVLLFDEPDCHLHPSKIELELINFIKRNLVNKMKFQVIITTHNPTTLSLFNKGK